MTMSSDTDLMATEQTFPAASNQRPWGARFWRVVIVIGLITSLVAGVPPEPASAQNIRPTIDDTARLLGHLWADGSYDDGQWDATGPSGGSDIIERLVIVHGGTWINRSELIFTLPAPYDWAEWKGGLPNDDDRTRQAVGHPNFLAALIEGEGSTAGLIYDQSSCCTAGFTSGRLTELRDLLLASGYSSATSTSFGDVDSGRVNIATSDFSELRRNLRFICPAVGSAIRVPGAENFAEHGPIRWLDSTSAYGDVVRTDCVNGQAVTQVPAPVGDCIVTNDGNGKLRITWTFQRGLVTIRRDGAFVTSLSAMNSTHVDSPSAGSHSYTVNALSDDLLTRASCGSRSTADATQPAPPLGVTCAGRVVTHMGTNGRDTIEGTEANDVIHGYGGDDTLVGLQGNDMICGGDGDDTVRAGQGNDVVWGGQGFDIIHGAQGNDVLRAVGEGETDSVGSRMFGGAGDDTLVGSNRWDRMQGGVGNDEFQGFEGRDWIRGGPDNDQIVGGGGIDDLHGGNGTDFIQLQGADIVRGGAGRDGCLSAGPKATVNSCEVTLTQTSALAFISDLG